MTLRASILKKIMWSRKKLRKRKPRGPVVSHLEMVHEEHQEALRKVAIKIPRKQKNLSN
jgi:hypothetical protein